MAEADQSPPGRGANDKGPCAINGIKDPAKFGIRFLVGKFFADDPVVWGKRFKTSSRMVFSASRSASVTGIIYAFIMLFLHLKGGAKKGKYNLRRAICQIMQDLLIGGQGR